MYTHVWVYFVSLRAPRERVRIPQPPRPLEAAAVAAGSPKRSTLGTAGEKCGQNGT